MEMFDGPMLYLLIFIAKIIETSIGTFRLIVVANGKKLIGAVLHFIGVFIWVIVASTVLVNIQEDPIKILVYTIGCAVGSYVGNLIEEKLAIGSSNVTVITDAEKGNTLAALLRRKGYAITELEGKGQDLKKKILLVIIKRKTKTKLLEIINKFDKDAVIMSETINSIDGGYIK